MYCQNDEADGKFKTFCDRFLEGLSIKQLMRENIDVKNESIPGPLFLVLILPCANRQNNLDVLTDSITEISNTFKLNGNYNY